MDRARSPSRMRFCYIFGTFWGDLVLQASLGPEAASIRFGVRSPKKGGSEPGNQTLQAGVHFRNCNPSAFRAFTIPRGTGPSQLAKQLRRAETVCIWCSTVCRENSTSGGDLFTRPAPPFSKQMIRSPVLGRTEIMIKTLGPSAEEVADPEELLEIAVGHSF